MEEEKGTQKDAAREALLGLTAGCSWHVRLVDDMPNAVGEFWLDWRNGHAKYGEGVLTGPTYQDGGFRAGPWAPVADLVKMLWDNPAGILRHIRALSPYAWHRNWDHNCDHDWEATLPGFLSVPVAEGDNVKYARFALTLRRIDDPEYWEDEVRPDVEDDELTEGWPEDWPVSPEEESCQWISVTSDADPTLSAVIGVRWHSDHPRDLGENRDEAASSLLNFWSRICKEAPETLHIWAASACWHTAGSIGQNDTDDEPWAAFAEMPLPVHLPRTAGLRPFVVLRRAKPEALRIELEAPEQAFDADDLKTMHDMTESYTLP